jgi:hypothetical protein
MKKDTKVESGLTVGVDLGDRWSRYCVLDQQGQILEEDTIASTGRAFRSLFGERPTARVVIEVGTHSPWVQRLLQELGHETITANPRYVRLIYSSRNKNDRLDAERLARLARVDTKLLHPIQHREGTTQADRGADQENSMPRVPDRALGIQAVSGNRAAAPDLRSRPADVVEFRPDVGGPGAIQDSRSGISWRATTSAFPAGCKQAA